MNSQDTFNRYYSQKNERYYSSSLLEFFESHIRSRLPETSQILELGSGSYSLFEEIKNISGSITAIDFSPKAIAKAPQSVIQYHVSDVCDSKFFPTSHYDLIFDAHCLNCLTKIEERQKALRNISNALREGAFFACELMVWPITGERRAIPFKVVQTALEWEQELQSFGPRIIYFMIVKESHFGEIVDGGEVHCDVLRVILQK